MARLRLNILLNSIETFFSFLLRTIAAIASVMETSVVESAAPFIPMAGTPRSPKIRTAFSMKFRIPEQVLIAVTTMERPAFFMIIIQICEKVIKRKEGHSSLR